MSDVIYGSPLLTLVKWLKKLGISKNAHTKVLVS